MENVFKNGRKSFLVRGELINVDDSVHYIVEGSVGVYSSENEKRSFLFAFKAGEIFPYSQSKAKLMSGRQIEYRCLSAVELLSIDKNKFTKEAYKPANIKPFVENLMEIMEVQIERIDNLEQGQVFQRLLERLNFFAGRLGVVHGDKIVIDSPMSHGDIATSIGTSRETVNRMMKSLEKEGLITIKRQTIIINSIKDLKRKLSGSGGRTNGKRGHILAASAAILIVQSALQSMPDL
jgi:CRP/FNR family transcriptional regulator, cyclic AMP receptor protein